jgi:hypothetical protein
MAQLPELSRTGSAAYMSWDADRNFDSALGLLSLPRALAQLRRLGTFRRLGAVVRNGLPIGDCIGSSAFRRCTPARRRIRPLRTDHYIDTIKGVVQEGGTRPSPDDDGQLAEKAGVTYRHGLFK